MQRCFTNILSERVSETASWYQDLLGMRRHFDSDWFVILTHDDLPGTELGILQRDHEIVPASIRREPAGVLVTFVVDDCDAAHRRAVDMNAEILEGPSDMSYGQRRTLLRDPDGTIVDVSSPTVSPAAG